MKWVIIGLALLALAGAGSSYLLWTSNADLRASNKEVKQQADKDVKAANAIADGWQTAYKQQNIDQQRDDKLQADLSELSRQLRADAAKSQGKYLDYLRSVSHDPQACENQPIPAALYYRLRLSPPTGDYPAGAGPASRVPEPTGKPGG